MLFNSRVLRPRCGTWMGVSIAVLLFAISLSAQSGKVVTAVVIDDDVLRDGPTFGARPVQPVLRGTELKVVPSYVKGWYFGFPSGIQITGYIHGDSIRIAGVKNMGKPKTKATPTPKIVLLDDFSAPKPPVLKGAPPFIPAKPKNACLPPNYCPDIGDVYQVLDESSSKFVKGEFEKTVDWEKRRASILNSIGLSDGKRASDEMVFLYEEGTGSFTFVTPKYDADSEKWTFPLAFSSEDAGACIPLMSEKNGHLYCLIAPKEMARLTSASVRMPPAIASINKGKLQIAFVGKILPPHLWVNGKTTYPAIFFELKETICLNPKTGTRWAVELNGLSALRTVDSMSTGLFSDVPPPPTISASEASAIVKETVSAVGEGIAKEDFSSFRRLLGIRLKERSDKQPLENDFRHLMESKYINATVLRSASTSAPEFSSPPTVFNKDGLSTLRLEGKFPRVSTYTTAFILTYTLEEGSWKLTFFDIEIRP